MGSANLEHCSQASAESNELMSAIMFSCGTLAQFFLHEPCDPHTGELLRAFSQIDVAPASSEWPFVSKDDAFRGLSLMQRGSAAALQTAEQATQEYRRLFVGPQKKAAPPWGSVYTDSNEVIFGESTLELRGWMRAHGIAKTVEPGMPEDHIGFLLDCAAWIAQHDPPVLGEFLEGHVVTWSSHYLEILAAETTHPLYQGLALLSDSTLSGISDALNLSPQIPRFYR